MYKKGILSKKIALDVIFFVLVIILVSFLVFSLKRKSIAHDEYFNRLPVYRTHISSIINRDNPDELVGAVDYVFVAKVVSEDGNEYKFPVEVETADDGEKVVADPYTNYSIEVMKNIKGELVTDQVIPMQKDGGLFQDGSGYQIYEGDALPVVGGTYIFYAETMDDGSLIVCGPGSNERINVEKKILNSEVVLEAEDALDTQIVPEWNQSIASLYEAD